MSEQRYKELLVTQQMITGRDEDGGCYRGVQVHIGDKIRITRYGEWFEGEVTAINISDSGSKNEDQPSITGTIHFTENGEEGHFSICGFSFDEKEERRGNIRMYLLIPDHQPADDDWEQDETRYIVINTKTYRVLLVNATKHAIEKAFEDNSELIELVSDGVVSIFDQSMAKQVAIKNTIVFKDQ